MLYNKIFLVSLLAASILLFPLAQAHGESAIDLNGLLDEMTDLERLTRTEENYTTHQFASYDRRSTDPTVLTEENWFANGDRGKHLREEQID
ncbi:MAG TPA: hypothetical protein PLC40_18665, partial [Candidatus Hydrogenedentes bacterium]|nr:hypothetical protein [Candidatus Hydrogenedentota bacterium]